MFDASNQATIFLPVLVIVLLTFVAFLKMGAGRAAAMKAGQDPNFYKTYQGAPEPDATIVAVRHYGNLFEIPTIYYAACLTLFVLSAVSGWSLVFAWGYVVARLLQSGVHLSYNNPAHRGGAFMIGVIFTLCLWVQVALAVLAHT